MQTNAGGLFLKDRPEYSRYAPGRVGKSGGKLFIGVRHAADPLLEGKKTHVQVQQCCQSSRSGVRAHGVLSELGVR